MNTYLQKSEHGDAGSPHQPKNTDRYYRVCVANEKAFVRHLKRLVKKYGAENVPLDEAFKFNFKWKCKRKKSVHKDS